MVKQKVLIGVRCAALTILLVLAAKGIVMMNLKRVLLRGSLLLSVISLVQIIGDGGLQLDSAIEIASCALTAAGLYLSFTGDAKGWFNV